MLLVNQYYLPAKAPTAKLLSEVGAALVAEGHQVTVIASRRGYHDSSKVFPRRNTIDGVDVRLLPGTAFTQKRRSGRVANYLAFFAVAAARMVTMHKPDVIVCLSSPPMLGTIVQAIARMRRTRMVYWVMDVHPELAFRLGHINPGSLTGKFLDRAARIPLGRADAVIALGDDMALHIKPHSNGNTRVVPNWADGDRIRPAEAVDHPLRKEWGWEHKFVIAYAGNMGLVHEFDTILDAATRLKDDDRYLFCFIGGGARTQDIRAEVNKRSLNNVEFRGYVPEHQLPQSLTAPNVHLVSLRSDLAGLCVPSKLYGILAAGKPVAFIGPQASDVASIVTDNGCGIHIQNGDVDGLVRAIRDYGGSSDVLAEHQEAARRTFNEGYTRSRGLGSITSLITG